MFEVNEAKENNYNRLKVLKEGGFGRAYLAEDLLHNDYCVIKETKTQMMKKSEIEDIKKEAEILKVLIHPNIIRFRDIYMNKKLKLCIVMDYADAGDLYSKIENAKGYFQEHEILDMFTQLCLAIKHIHDRKIVHRDLKSQNVFLNKMGMIKLGDFGISKILNHTHDLLTSFVGTWYYISPEIVKGQHYSFKTDIWSLGVILYELCCLKLPFRGQNQFVLQRKILDGKYSPIPTRYSEELRQLVDDLLVLNPANRPSIYQILAKPIIKNRITRFLDEKHFEEEFSHTILHNQNVMAAGRVGAVVKPPMLPVPSPGLQKNYASNQVLPPYVHRPEDAQGKVVGRRIDQVQRIGGSAIEARLEGLRNRAGSASRFGPPVESALPVLPNPPIPNVGLLPPNLDRRPNEFGLRHHLPAAPNVLSPQGRNPLLPQKNNFFNRIDDMYDRLREINAPAPAPSPVPVAAQFDLEGRLRDMDKVGINPPVNPIPAVVPQGNINEAVIGKYREDFQSILEEYRQAMNMQPVDYMPEDDFDRIDRVEEIEEMDESDSLHREDRIVNYKEYVQRVFDTGDRGRISADRAKTMLDRAMDSTHCMDIGEVFKGMDGDPALLLLMAVCNTD